MERLHTLAFFPWLTLREEMTTDAFELIHYSRSRAVASAMSIQSACDAVLEMYRPSPGVSVERATILRLTDRGPIDHLDGAEIDQVLRWGELVAFSGLAARQFFNTLGYANRDSFRLFVQNFDKPAAGIWALSRRRDGSSRILVSREAAVFIRPLHVPYGLNSEIDAGLLRALIARSRAADWGRFEEAIQQFASANTDSPDMLPETEAVNMVGAFERLFDLSHGKEDELAARFVLAVSPAESMAPASSDRVLNAERPEKYTKRGSMREVWIRDFFQLRGQHAHGKIDPLLVSLWALREHLLLAAFIFPLVVKSLLAETTHYRLTAEDMVRIDAFEALLGPNHFADGGPAWNRTIDAVRQRRWISEYVVRSDDGPPTISGGTIGT